ncbi:MAG TPA: hypothetical protein VFX70_21750 [Mycobacteriales bacterium]|nr:hypothetical protein [Mycobacteriales bacterium]
MGTDVEEDEAGNTGGTEDTGDGWRADRRVGGEPTDLANPPDRIEPPVLPDTLSTVRLMSTAREVDGARAWEFSDRLARLALLVTGSPDRAYRLTRETLISVGRSAPYVQARRKLLRRAVRGRVDGYAAGLLPGMSGPTPAARLWRRLMGLPAVDRALVVLTEAEGMADAVAGAVLGLPRMETERTLAGVRESLEVQAQLTEAERREVFDGPALLPASGVVPTQALARAQRSRRVRRGLAAVAAVLVLAGGAMSVVAVRSDRGAEPLRRADSLTRVDDPMRWAARGDLLDDAALLRASVRVWRARGLGGDPRGRVARGNRGGPGDDLPGPDGTLPTLLWAGRLTGGRSLVVLAGRGFRNDQVVGVLLDRGPAAAGLTLVRMLPAAPTAALDLGAVAPDGTSSHRYLVSPWFSSLSVVEPDGDPPSGSPPGGAADGTERLGLHDGLSVAWAGRGATCSRPLLALFHPGSSSAGGPGQTSYALGSAGAGPAVGVGDPPAGVPTRAAYFTALHGLSTCPGPPAAQSAASAPSLLTGLDAQRVTVSDLAVAPLWAGRMPDGTAGQALRLSWRIDPRSAEPGSDANLFGQVFVVVTGGTASYSAVLRATSLAHTIGTVGWTSARNRHRYLLLASGPGIARVDLLPRPKGFKPGHPVAFLSLPRRERGLSAVGVDGSGRIVSAQPVGS